MSMLIERPLLFTACRFNAVDLKEMILKSEVNSQRLIRHARSNGLIIYESNKLGKVFN